MAFLKWSFGDARSYPNCVARWPDFEFSDDWLLSRQSDFIIDLETIKSSLVPFNKPCENTESGVYILFRRGSVSYVGQSKNLRQRLEKHSDRIRGVGKDFDSYFIIDVPHYFLDDVESFYIKTLSPPDNIANGRSCFKFNQPTKTRTAPLLPNEL